jgi:hypothetical protein
MLWLVQSHTNQEQQTPARNSFKCACSTAVQTVQDSLNMLTGMVSYWKTIIVIAAALTCLC